MTTEILQRIERALEDRFGTAIPVAAGQPGSESLARLLEHRSHRKYAARPVSAELLRLLFACALASPSKSDLQQADIVHVADAAKRKVIADLIPDMPWVREAPVFLVFCGNNRRRAAQQPYAKQRGVGRYGKAEFYGWSEDKARQYSVAERADFGAFIRGKRFNLT